MEIRENREYRENKRIRGNKKINVENGKNKLGLSQAKLNFSLVMMMSKLTLQLVVSTPVLAHLGGWRQLGVGKYKSKGKPALTKVEVIGLVYLKLFNHLKIVQLTNLLLCTASYRMFVSPITT